MDNKSIKEKYSSVANAIEKAVEETHGINVEGKEENRELNAINQHLESLNVDFKQEINKLESSSEWERFCIAFFGETNAGKSTIIESLRIIYDEETRRAELLAQEEKYRGALNVHCDEYQKVVDSLKLLNDELIAKKEKTIKNILPYALLTVLGFAAGFVTAYLVFM